MITEYSLMKVSPVMKHHGHEWLPLNPTTYRVNEDSVTSETAGALNEYHDCVILSPGNWECRHSDGSGRFGFKNGEFWSDPEPKGIKFVSRLEYNYVRCKWAIQDEYDGKFMGAARCILGWK